MATLQEQLWQNEPHVCHYCPMEFDSVYDTTADHIVAKSKRRAETKDD